MASSVFYKFKSQREESRVTFDGTGISVFDLKREIILATNMAKANDFDLHLYDPNTNQEFNDDAHIIPRSSSVIVKRLPAARPGKGKASLYVNAAAPADPHRPAQPAWHKGPMSKRFDGKDDPAHPSRPKNPPPSVSLLFLLRVYSYVPGPQIPVANNVTKEDEAAAMAAMFQAQSQNWEETQEKMSQLVSPERVLSSVVVPNLMNHSAQAIHRNPRGTPFAGRGGKPHQPHQPINDRPLPPSYVCYRCGQKGHWIQDCPTNSDREFDHRPRIKRTTGIPRSMLKTVDNPNNGQLTQGVMVTPEGGYVVAQPDLASWQKQVKRSKGLTPAEVREKPPSDESLACPIDNKLFRDAVRTPCCDKIYCEECIQTLLLEQGFICPNCTKKIPSLDKLIVDKPARTKVADYIEKAIEESKKDGADDSKAKPDGDKEDGAGTAEEPNPGDQDIYSDQQPDLNIDMSQMVVEHIPQLQAQIHQISQALQNPNLPDHVRHQTEMQFRQLQFQLQQAQTVQTALAFQQQQQQAVAAQAGVGVGNVVSGNMANMAAMGMGMPGFNPMAGFQQGMGGNNWTAQQPVGQDSAYQRLPVNNRRRNNLKRDRPSDFFDSGADGSKVPRYWE